MTLPGNARDYLDALAEARKLKAPDRGDAIRAAATIADNRLLEHLDAIVVWLSGRHGLPCEGFSITIGADDDTLVDIFEIACVDGDGRPASLEIQDALRAILRGLGYRMPETHPEAVIRTRTEWPDLSGHARMAAVAMIDAALRRGRATG